MAAVKDTDYLFVSTRVRALEGNLLTEERMARMLEARTDSEALQVLADCGYAELDELDNNSINLALAEEQQRAFADIASFLPRPLMLDVFKVKYDYHNAKSILKGEAMGTSASHLLIDLGRVPAKSMRDKIVAGDVSGIPPILQTAIVQAKETLGTTSDPQLSDFILDAAYYLDMFEITRQVGSAFLTGYVKISIDAANLRTIVRTLRMDKPVEFIQQLLFPGGNVDPKRLMQAINGSLSDVFSTSLLKEAAEIAGDLLEGGRLTQFEKLCDNAVLNYLKKAKQVPFGEAPVVAYLAAKESELTAVRIILTGRQAKLPADIIHERLRDAYV